MDKASKKITVSLFILTVLIAAAICAPFLSAHDPYATHLGLEEILQPPSLKHLFGTDQLGRDIFSRTVYGARISLSVGIIAVLIMMLIGISVGAVSGYFGRFADMILMRFTEIIMCVPTLFLILMILAFVGPSIANVMIVIGITSWPTTARLVRGEVLSLKEREFVIAGRALGVSHVRIIFIHILSNAVAPIAVNAVFAIAGAILAESALSFLGLGVQVPVPSWGNILMDGKNYLDSAWWIMFFPGFFILIAVLSCNLLAEGLREIFDPKTGENAYH